MYLSGQRHHEMGMPLFDEYYKFLLWKWKDLNLLAINQVQKKINFVVNRKSLISYIMFENSYNRGHTNFVRIICRTIGKSKMLAELENI